MLSHPHWAQWFYDREKATCYDSHGISHPHGQAQRSLKARELPSITTIPSSMFQKINSSAKSPLLGTKFFAKQSVFDGIREQPASCSRQIGSAPWLPPQSWGRPAPASPCPAAGLSGVVVGRALGAPHREAGRTWRCPSPSLLGEAASSRGRLGLWRPLHCEGTPLRAQTDQRWEGPHPKGGLKVKKRKTEKELKGTSPFLSPWP